MISFCISLVALVLGYVFYGAVVERVFGVEPDRPTPCFTKQDGVDYIPMPTWKVFLIQFLNIAGTGPIFGAIMGILFGPAAYLWIVLGCIFAGATHDYMGGMISLRKGGISIPEFVGDELGAGIRLLMRVFSMVLLVLVAAVFVATPANLLSNMTSGWGAFGTVFFWSALIFFYYILATLLPVSALIGRIYPLFGLAMLIMAVGLAIGIFTHDGWMPELTDPLTGHHPKGLPVFPMLCITIACGAISGFHGTQSPMMARCLKSERMGRRVFYGAMIAEGLVALIWAAASIKYAGGYQQLADMGNPAVVVSTLCSSWMGRIGAILAILGVVVSTIDQWRYCLAQRPTDGSRLPPLPSEQALEASRAQSSHLRGVRYAVVHRLQCALALLRMVQSDACLHDSVGCECVVGTQGTLLLDYTLASHVHDRSVYQLHTGCT